MITFPPKQESSWNDQLNISPSLAEGDEEDVHGVNGAARASWVVCEMRERKEEAGGLGVLRGCRPVESDLKNKMDDGGKERKSRERCSW